MSATVLTPSVAPGPSGASRAVAGGLRLLVALSLAGAITVALFMVMEVLIRSDAPPPAEVIEPRSVTISFTPPEFDPPRGPRNPNLDAPIAPPPAAPRIVAEAQSQPMEGGFAAAAPTLDQDVVMEGMDRIALPPPPLDTRVEPVYPRGALARGVQGDCTIRYDILASGRTANLSVVACDARGFERASLDAVAGWRHAAARGQDPNAVLRRGVTTTLSFRLQD